MYTLYRTEKGCRGTGEYFPFSISVFDQFNLVQIRLLSYQSAYLNMFMYSGKPNSEKEGRIHYIFVYLRSYSSVCI